MALKPIGPEIKSTEIEENFETLDDKIDKSIDDLEDKIDDSIEDGFVEYLTIEESFDRSFDTNISLGYKPRLVEIDANIRASRYKSRGYIGREQNGVMFSLNSSDTDTQIGSRSVYFYSNSSNYISGSGEITDNGFKISWTVEGSLPGASGNRRMLIVVHK